MKVMTKRAIIHVENTEGVIEFADYLSNAGWTILTANKTEELLRREHISVVHEPALVENVLYFNESAKLIQALLNSKYPTSDESYRVPQEEEKDIYILCLNLYPSISNFSDLQHVPENSRPASFFISTLLRNTTINYTNVLILTDPDDYKEAMVQLRTDNITNEFRLYLAAKALNLISAYDSGIADSLLLNSSYDKTKNIDFLNYLTFPFKKMQNLQSGANPQQKACIYKYPAEIGVVTGLQKMHAKELQYNVIADASLAWEEISKLYNNLKKQFTVKSTNKDGYAFVTQFTPLTGTVFTIAVKYKSIVGAALSSNVIKSFKNTYTYDISSIDDVTIGCSSVIDEAAAKEMVNCKLAAIIAPGFTPRAKETLSANKHIKLIATSKIHNSQFDFEQINGGMLFQTRDNVIFDHWYVKTRNRPTQEMADQMIFGMLLAIASRTYSSVLLKNNSIVGISQACKSQKKAVGLVLSEANDYAARNQIPQEEPLAELLVCDTAVTLCDPIKELIDRGLKAIIQTGNTDNDEELINYCDEHNVVMVFTGMSHITY